MIKTETPVNRIATFEPEPSPVAWQHALANIPNSHALQSWTWADFKSRWGWRPMPFVLTAGHKEQKPIAAAMVLKRQLPRLPLSILYVPKGPAFDYEDGALRLSILTELEKIARHERAIFIKIDPDVVRSTGLEPERPAATGTAFIQELQSRGWRFSNEQIQFRNTVLLDLTQSEDELLAAMKQKTRYNIRLAARKGITIRPGTPDDWPVIASLYRQTAARDGFGIRPSAYYLDAWTSFYEDNMAHSLLAEYEGEPIAAVILVRWRTRSIYMYGASSTKERNRMPNYLLQWEAIRWAKSQGCTHYDLWGAPDEFVETDRLWGVWRFKQGFKGEVVRHIGAWDYVVRPFWYWIYTVAIPRYLNRLRSRAMTGYE